MPIAFDAATSLGNCDPCTSLTTAHTCTGNDRILFIGATTDVGSDVVTSMTYNAVALTNIASAVAPTDRGVNMRFLTGPATGSNNCVVNRSGSGVIYAVAGSYTGASSTGQPDANSTSTIENSSTHSASVTTIADNCWVVFSGRNNQAVPSAGAGTTSRVTSGFHFIMDNNAAVTPPASTTLNASSGDGTSDWASVIASFSPASAAVSTPSSLSLLGVGM